MIKWFKELRERIDKEFSRLFREMQKLNWELTSHKTIMDNRFDVIDKRIKSATSRIKHYRVTTGEQVYEVDAVDFRQSYGYVNFYDKDEETVLSLPEPCVIQVVEL